jgi:hypothetical protein
MKREKQDEETVFHEKTKQLQVRIKKEESV